MAQPQIIVTQTAPTSDNIVTDAELSATSGAAMVGIADAGSYYTATNVEVALQEIQTDVSSAYVPYTGATINVDLGTKELIAGTTKFGDGGTTNYASFATDGELTLTGTARVTKSIWLDAGSVKSPGGNPASFVECGLTGVWEFSNAIEANQESVSGTLKIPEDMDITVAPTFNIGWHANGVSPGNCRWKLEYLWISPNEDTSAAAQESLEITSTASATSDGFIFATFTGIDIPSGTDKAMLWRITRESGDALDTIADTTELRGLALTYTSNKLGTAL